MTQSFRVLVGLILGLVPVHASYGLAGGPVGDPASGPTADPTAGPISGPTGAAVPRAQTEAKTDALPPEVAARVGSVVITMEQYRDYLMQAYGREPLAALIDRGLLRAEGARLELSISAEEIAAAVDRVWAGYLVRLKGDEKAFIDELARGGFQAEEYRALLAQRGGDELLAQAICIATREVTEANIVERFHRDYGPDGDRVEVRHVFLNPARERADLIRSGVPTGQLGEAELEQRLRAKCTKILARLADGADFATVAAEEGHDMGARVTGGALENYNYRAYGEEFSTAVRAAELGLPVGPVRSQAGFHIIEVTSRVHSELDDVRADLRAALAREPAEFAEVEAMRARLRARDPIETY